MQVFAKPALQIQASDVQCSHGATIGALDADASTICARAAAEAHPHDVGELLDQQGVAVRTGHHCAMPLMERLGLPGTVRASFGLYNSRADVDALAAAARKALSLL